MTQKEMQADLVIARIEECKGNLTMACKLIGCSRQTLYNYIKSHPTVQAALETARESMIDNVESVLYSKALAGEVWAVCFFLKTQGKRRGYIERSELTTPDDKPLTIRVIYDSSETDTDSGNNAEAA